MEKIYLSIAGFVIEIVLGWTEYIYAKNKIKNDILSDLKGFVIHGKQKKIDYYLKIIEDRSGANLFKKNNKQFFITFYERIAENKIVSYYHTGISQIQTILIGIIQSLLSRSQGFMLHGSAINVGDGAYIFLGKPCGGKSTIIDLLKEKYQGLADDISIIKKENDIFNFYQIPKAEKISWIIRSKNRYPLERVFFLRKANYYKINKINNQEIILRNLMKQLFTEKEDLKPQLKYLSDFVTNYYQFYILYFGRDGKKIVKLI